MLDFRGEWKIDGYGNIRHIKGDKVYSVYDLARCMEKHDKGHLVKIHTPELIELLGNTNIDDKAALFLCNGSIVQNDGDDIYSLG